MKRLLLSLVALSALVAAPAAAGTSYRISNPNVWHEAGDTHVSGFVCRTFNLAAPPPSRVHVALYDTADKLVAAGDVPLQGGTLEAKGVSCGHYSAVLAGDGTTKVVVSALGTGGQVVDTRAVAAAI